MWSGRYALTVRQEASTFWLVPLRVSSPPPPACVGVPLCVRVLHRVVCPPHLADLSLSLFFSSVYLLIRSEMRFDAQLDTLPAFLMENRNADLQQLLFVRAQLWQR